MPQSCNKMIRTNSAGMSRTKLSRLVQKGELERVARGLYASPESELTEHHSLVEATCLVPRGIVCLLSALSFHNLTTQSPFEVWIAVDVKSKRLPRVAYPPLHVVWFSGSALNFGVEEHVLEGHSVKITSPAKTVADCFKYRNKIGVDIAIEALRDYLRQAKSWDSLWEACKACRMTRIIQPYLAALT